MVSHDVLLLVADQLQPELAVTLTDPVPAAALKDWAIGVMPLVQGAAPSCATLKVWPPIVSVAFRAVVLVFCVTA